MKQKVFTVLAILTMMAMLPGAAMAASSSPRTTLHGSAPAWANSNNFAGAADPNGAVGFRVYLGWKNVGAAEALARAVSDPNSPSYRQYVSAAQFRQKFAPSQSDVKAVQSWLKSQGFSIVYTPTNNHYVSAEGTVAQAQTAFAAHSECITSTENPCDHLPVMFLFPLRWQRWSPVLSGSTIALYLSRPTISRMLRPRLVSAMRLRSQPIGQNLSHLMLTRLALPTLPLRPLHPGR